MTRHANVIKISFFKDKLSTYSHTLHIMRKLKEAKGYVRMTLVKLPIIYENLARIDDDKLN